MWTDERKTSWAWNVKKPLTWEEKRREEKKRHGCILLDVLHCGSESLCRNVFYWFSKTLRKRLGGASTQLSRQGQEIFFIHLSFIPFCPQNLQSLSFLFFSSACVILIVFFSSRSLPREMLHVRQNSWHLTLNRDLEVFFFSFFLLLP